MGDMEGVRRLLEASNALMLVFFPYHSRNPNEITILFTSFIISAYKLGSIYTLPNCFAPTPSISTESIGSSLLSVSSGSNLGSTSC